ncbi:MAG: oxidoreductase [Planctomycetes bacterium]|nr:oxidoreductase [Planctomycetota bacterium]
MTEKVKIAMTWAAACGGCDVALLDLEERLLDLTRIADVVYWPVALDFKRRDLAALPDGGLDIGLFNGAVRTSEQEEDALLLRRKAKVLVAFGACAAFGGVPGLANLSDREGIFATAYGSTPSTENPNGLRPEPRCVVNGGERTLPEFHDTVRSLAQVAAVDLVLPGCPPPAERLIDLVEAVARFAATGETPPCGTVLAHDKALCDECPRNSTRRGGRVSEFRRPHEVLADPEVCFLEQGLLCLGIATRGGCGLSCLKANMPCRGCFGPTAQALDPAAEALSALGSIAGDANENDVPAHVMKRGVQSIRDPAGTFYRFTLPSACLNRAVRDVPAEKSP